MINIKMTGVNELLAELENRLGKEAMQRISDEALLKGAKLFVKILNAYISTSGKYAKGWTVADTSIGDIETINGVRNIKIHWNGPHGRYRIIHLNEWGTVKTPNPPRKGAIAKAMREAEQVYRNAVKQAVWEGL